MLHMIYQRIRNARSGKLWRTTFGSHKSTLKEGPPFTTMHNLSKYGRCFWRSILSSIPRIASSGSSQRTGFTRRRRHIEWNFLGTPLPRCRPWFGGSGLPQSVRFSLGLSSKTEFGRRIDLREGDGQIADYAIYATKGMKQRLTSSFNVAFRWEFGHLWRVFLDSMTFIWGIGKPSIPSKIGGMRRFTRGVVRGRPWPS